MAGPAVLVAGSPACAPNGAVPTQEVTVFAAASLSDAFQEIGQELQRQSPNFRVVFNFASSGQLRGQIEQGARADVFASANQAEMDRAKTARLIVGQDQIFARNRLTVALPAGGLPAIEDLKDLARPGVKLITAAPEVPVAIYTQGVLEAMAKDPAYGGDFKERINANIVSREPNVRLVVAKVALGEADAALVYATDVGPDLRPNVRTLEIPDRFNVVADYPIAVVKDAPSPAGAEAFTQYVLGSRGQAALKRWGFMPVG